MTQERSKVLQETEANPFGDDEEEEAARAAKSAPKSTDGPIFNILTAGPSSLTAPHSSSSGHSKQPSSGGSIFGSKDKKKDKSKSSGKRKTFNLDMEKEQMKSVIAEASISSTNLMNALQSINREKERISDNHLAVQRFEICKQLRRRVLRYVRTNATTNRPRGGGDSPILITSVDSSCRA